MNTYRAEIQGDRVTISQHAEGGELVQIESFPAGDWMQLCAERDKLRARVTTLEAALTQIADIADDNEWLGTCSHCATIVSLEDIETALRMGRIARAAIGRPEAWET